MKSQTHRTIGQTLEAYCLTRGLYLKKNGTFNKRALCVAAGVDPANYARWNNGEVAMPNLAGVQRIASLLKLTVSQILGEQLIPEIDSGQELSAQELEFLDLFRRLPKRERKIQLESIRLRLEE